MSSESSAEVQREAEAERAELVSTLDQLRENLKPSNVVDEVMASAKVTTSDITDKVWQTARANPVAAVLIGVGAAMILGLGSQLRTRSVSASDWNVDDVGGNAPLQRWRNDSNRRSYEPEFEPESDEPGLTSRLKRLGTWAADSASQVSKGALALTDPASQTVSAYASSARDGLASLSGDDLMTQYSRSRDQVVGSLSRLLDDQPLVLAALGVAVGAAIGAAIPSTEAEGRLMGDASVSLKTRAQELAQQEYAHLKETASATLGDLKQTAADHGMSADNVSGLIQDVGSKVRDAASDVANHAAEQGGPKS